MKNLKNKVGLIISFLSLILVLNFGVSAQTSSFAQQELEKKVRKELVTLPWTGVFDNLGFKVEGDTVTLYGQVVQPSSKSSAGKRVAKLAGVKNVINNIEVLPLSNFDDRIRIQAFRQIADTGGLYRYLLGANPSLRIIVNNGNVTLEGVVANKTDARLAEITANQIFGVFSVKNNLVIASERIG